MVKVQTKANTYDGGRGRLFLVATILFLSCCAVWPVWMDILSIGVRDHESSHVFLVPLVVGYLLYQRRQTLAQFSGDFSWFGLVLLAGGVSCFYVGLEGSIVVLWHLSAILVLYGVSVIAMGFTSCRRILPALIALLFLIPIPGLLRHEISRPLQHLSATASQWIASTMGVSVEQNGYLLAIDGTQIAIAEACNGMRMLFAMLLVLYAFCFSRDIGPKLRLMLLALSPLVAIIMNCVRIITTVLMFAWAPEGVALLFHDLSGWLVPLSILAVVFVLFPVHSRDPSPDLRVAGNFCVFPVAAGLSLVLLVFLLSTAMTPQSEQIEIHRQRVVRAIDDMPYSVGGWIGKDDSLHREELELLKPIAAFRRTYRNVEHGTAVTVFVSASKHARDLVGHEPGICFTGQGWTELARVPSVWNVEKYAVNGDRFEFAWPKPNESASMKVCSILVLPTGETTADTRELASVASDFRLEQFGATAIQISTTCRIEDLEWDRVSQEFVDTLLPVIAQYKENANRIDIRNQTTPVRSIIAVIGQWMSLGSGCHLAVDVIWQWMMD